MASIVLILETGANWSPREVKDLLKNTKTNMYLYTNHVGSLKKNST